MKKIFLSSFLIVFFGVYVLYQRIIETEIENLYVAENTQKPTNSLIVIPKPPSTITPKPTTTTPKPILTPAPTPAPITNSGLYVNGQYTGPVADAYYGNVQVKVTISGGRITDVQFLDYPQDRQNSIRINTRAIPLLVSEAISAQNSNVDTVSGASATSGAFRESLAGALAQARK